MQPIGVYGQPVTYVREAPKAVLGTISMGWLSPIGDVSGAIVLKTRLARTKVAVVRRKRFAAACMLQITLGQGYKWPYGSSTCCTCTTRCAQRVHEH